MPPQLLTETVNCAPEPHAGSVVTLTRNTPRFPAPFFVVTVRVLEPLPSSRTSDNPSTRLFPFPAWEALMVRTPVAFVIVNVVLPVLCASTLWLNDRELGLSVVTHCGIGVADGDALGVGVGVGVGVPLPLPLPLFPSLPLPFPFPFPFGVGVGVAVGVGVGVGLEPSPGDGLAVGLGDAVAAGVGVAWSTSSPGELTETSGISWSGKYWAQMVTSPEPETSTGI